MQCRKDREGMVSMWWTTTLGLEYVEGVRVGEVVIDGDGGGVRAGVRVDCGRTWRRLWFLKNGRRGGMSFDVVGS